LQGDVYDKIDALIGANIIFGGTISAEGFGTHTLSAGSAGLQTLLVRNTSAGTSNAGLVSAQGDGAGVISMQMASSTFTTSTGLVANGGRLVCTGSAGMAIEASAASGVRLMSNSTLRATVDVNGVTVENNHAFYVRNAGGNGIVGFTVSGSNAMSIGSDSAASVGELTINAGSAIRFRMNSAERIVMTSTGVLQVPDGSGSAPTYSFSSDTDTGLFQEDAGVVSVASNGQKIVDITRAAGESYSVAGETVAILPARAVGTGNIPGHTLAIGYNSSGSGAAGTVRLYRRGGGSDFVWSDDGTLRIGGTAPRENDATAHSSGTIVGTQTSSREVKRNITAYTDTTGALQIVRDTPVFSFRYKPGHGIQGEDFVGIITEESPMFGMDNGKSLNTVNAVGLLVASVQALAERLEALEA
jgi:hypothetical protein